MKMTREKTEDGMFFGIHISNEEMAQKFSAITTLSIFGITEEPTTSNILAALMAMASEIEEEEKRDKEWQELLELEEQEISEAGRPDGMKQMARQIGEQMEERAQEDIETWAERLADDVSKATD